MFKKITSLLVIIFIGNSVFANFDYNKNCKAIYSDIIYLRFNKAEKLIKQEKVINPNNSIILYLENYIDFLKVILKQEEGDYENLSKKVNARIEKISADDKSSPYYLYTLSEINLQWSILRFTFKDYFKGSVHFYNSYKEIKENIETFPYFEPSIKINSLFNLIIGSIPSEYKWITNTIGFEGDVTTGFNGLKKYFTTHRHNISMIESCMYLVIAYNIMGEGDEKAFTFINTIEDLPLENPLIRYIYARVAIHAGETEKAIAALEKYTQKSDEYPYYFLDYMLGTAKLNRLDANANIFLERFINEYKGKNYLKFAYKKLAWFYYLKGDAINYKKNVENIKKYGDVLVDADKQALKEFKDNRKINKELLKARILFDGGYYNKSYKILASIYHKLNSFNNRDRLEYYYRIGRVYDKQKKTDKAIKMYNMVLSKNKDEYYFTAFSALSIAYIYEEENNLSDAEKYYKLCLKQNNSEYKNSIEQKAKAGLDRIKSKKDTKKG